MNIQRALESEHSKELTERVIAYVGNDASRFNSLMEIFLGDNALLAQRAAWPFGYIASEHSPLLKNYYPQLLKKLSDSKQHNAIHRNILRAFSTNKLPEKFQAQILDSCLNFITSERQPAAIRAYAITTACNISREHPELRKELKMILDELDRLPQSPAIKVRVKQAYKILAR